jgi:undecaprenyl-diphosphatase
MVLGFLASADEVSEGESAHFDAAILQMLRRADDPHVPVGPLWLVSAAQDVSALGNRPLLIVTVLVVIGYLALERMYHALGLVVIAVSGGGLLNTLLKYLFARERPDVVPHLVPVTSLSFPSGHSVLAAVMYLTLGALLARVAVHRRTRLYVLTVAMLATFLVGVSRVYLGVHYPTDVLAGWCVGLAWALLCWLVARSLQRRGAVEAGPRV